MKFSALSLSLAMIGIVASDATGVSGERNRLLLQVLDKDIVDCDPDSPCDECQGDCDTDEDCAGDLICYQRDKASSDEDAVVPGCDGLSYSRTDFCVVVAVNDEDDADDNDEEEMEIPDEMETDDDDEEGDATAIADEETAAPVTPATTDPPESTTAAETPEGFEPGATNEILGMWMGEERYLYEGELYTYCSKAFFQPGTPGSNYLSWHSQLLGNSSDGTELCEDMGVDVFTGGVENEEYHNVAVESYLLGVGYKACLSDSMCGYDVTESGGAYEDYDLVAKSCGVHLKENLLSGGYDCEVYQISRLSQGGEAMIDVAVLVYGDVWQGGFANFNCPELVSFDVDDLMEDDSMLGATRMVRQLGYGSYAMTNLTDWECTVE